MDGNGISGMLDLNSFPEDMADTTDVQITQLFGFDDTTAARVGVEGFCVGDGNAEPPLGDSTHSTEDGIEVEDEDVMPDVEDDACSDRHQLLRRAVVMWAMPKAAVSRPLLQGMAYNRRGYVAPWMAKRPAGHGKKSNRNDYGGLPLNNPPKQHSALSNLPITDGISMFKLLSREDIEEAVMNALKDKDVKVIGICGMAGIGKSTMARNLLNRVMMDETLFDETAVAVVDNPINIFKIQSDIAKSLHYGGINQFDSEAERARRLFERLIKKRVLLHLDDIWKAIPLEDLGIPVHPHGCCTVLLTSRNQKALSQMNATKVFNIQTLPESEALSLFKSEIGTCANDPSLTDIVKEFAKECQGIPLSISFIGNVLRNQEKHVWQNALRQLREAPTERSPVVKQLKNSFSDLEPQGQLLFLLCSIYPKDSVIELEDLVWYTMGLEMFKGIQNLEDAWNVVFKSVDLLKSRFLLLDCGYGNEVKMHDVVRDLGRSIASEKGLIDSHEEKWKYLFITEETWVPSDQFLESKSLNLLIIHHLSSLEISDISFLEGMYKLEVLSLRNISFNKLPVRIHRMRVLRSLILVGCSFESLSPVHVLIDLEIFMCCECNSIKELPIEMKYLTKLKFFDLSDCENLKRIPRGLISELIELEELKMLNSFKKWEKSIMAAEENGQGQNAILKEVESLKKLRRLEIEIEDTNLVEEEMELPPQLSAYKIRIGGGLLNRNVEKALSVSKLSRMQKFGKWMHELVSTTQGFYAEGDGWENLDLRNAHSTITELVIQSCGVSALITQFNANPNHHELQNLFFLERAEEVFLCLETLVIEDCSKMKQVFFLNENNEDDISITFPRLKVLSLIKLPSLTTIWKGMQSIELPSLEELNIIDCNQLKCVVSATENGHICGEECDDGELHLFCARKVKFNKLERLFIQNFDGNASLFSSSASENLTSLKQLEINQCRNMEKLITGKKNEDSTLFPALEYLEIENMQSLKWICEWECTLTVPLMRVMTAVGIPNLSKLTSGSLKTQNLYKLLIDHESPQEFKKREDLNEVYVMHKRTTSETSKLSGTSTPSKTVGSTSQTKDVLPPIATSSQLSETPSRFKEHHEELEKDSEDDVLMGQNDLSSENKKLMQKNNDLVILIKDLMQKHKDAVNLNKELLEKNDVMNHNKESMHRLMEKSKELMHQIKDSNELIKKFTDVTNRNKELMNHLTEQSKELMNHLMKQIKELMQKITDVMNQNKESMHRLMERSKKLMEKNTNVMNQNKELMHDHMEQSKELMHDLMEQIEELVQKITDVMNQNMELIHRLMEQSRELMQKNTDVMNQNKELMHPLMEHSKELMQKITDLMKQNKELMCRLMEQSKKLMQKITDLMKQNKELMCRLMEQSKKLMQKNTDVMNQNKGLMHRFMEESKKSMHDLMQQIKELLQKVTDVMNENKELIHSIMEKSNELLMAQMEGEKKARKKLQESMDCMVKTIEGFKETKI